MTLGMMIWGSYWWLMIPGLLLGIYAQMKLSSTYARFSQVPSQRGITGAQTARYILDQNGLQDVPVGEVPGQLSDHYDPTKKALFLSSDIYHGTSLAAMGVAAHETGHALQHKVSYAFLSLRSALVPVTNFASTAAFWIFFLGMFMNYAKFAMLAVVIFGIITLFQVVTLPVEFDASSRAKAQLQALGLVSPEESAGVSKVLSAAAMTYVAAMVSSAMTLLQFVLMARGSDRD
jgi:Zn-dependent membrane protease YugP